MPRACPICGSKKWRKDAVTGSAVCEDGHVFADFRSENLVVENTGYTLQRRTLKRAPRGNKRRDEGNRNRDYYQGDDAEYLKVQAMQLLLRLQVQALAKLWSLPDAFELIVKDLWAYQLAISSLPDSPAASDPTTSAGPEEAQAEGDAGEGEEKDDSSGSSTGDDFEAEILAQLSDDTDKEEGDDPPLAEVGPEVKWKRKRRIHISDTLTCLIVGLWVVRYPVMNKAVESLVNGNTLPYLDFGRTTLIPAEMRRHMSRDVKLALSPRRCPMPLTLHLMTLDFTRRLTRHFQQIIPEINLPPLTWRVVSSVGATPTTYNQVINLLRLFDVNLSLSPRGVETTSRRAASSAPTGSVTHEYEKAMWYEDAWLPEVTVASAFIIVMKMTYGLDGKERHALVKTDPVIGLRSAEAWLEELSEKAASGAFRGDRTYLEKQDFARMDVSDIDRYLDRSEQVLLNDHEMSTHSDPAFPLPPHTPSAEPTGISWTHYHSSIDDLIGPSAIRTNMANKQLPLLPGERLRVYDSEDITGTLPNPYETLQHSCAETVGVTPDHLSKCIETFERKLEKLRIQRSEKERSRSRSQSRQGASRPR